MNSLLGEIEDIEISGNLSLVSLNVGSCKFKSILIETPKTLDFLQIGGKVNVLFKETEVIIGLDENIKISLRNKMTSIITSIEKGKLLSKLELDTDAGKVISIITSIAVENLKLIEGAKVIAMVKTNEILVTKC